VHPFLIHGSLGPYESTPKWHLDWFFCFCRAHWYAQQIHRLMMENVTCTNRPHLCNVCDVVLQVTSGFLWNMGHGQTMSQAVVDAILHLIILELGPSLLSYVHLLFASNNVVPRKLMDFGHINHGTFKVHYCRLCLQFYKHTAHWLVSYILMTCVVEYTIWVCKLGELFKDSYMGETLCGWPVSLHVLTP